MPHAIRPKRYIVELDDGTTYECRVIAADILKAEETAPTYGIRPERSPIRLTLLWVWAASRRQNNVQEGWPEFLARLVDWTDLSRAVEETPVDPTQPAGSTLSPSASEPTDSAASTSTGGSAPSSRTPN